MRAARVRAEPPSGRIAITATPSSVRERQQPRSHVALPRVVRHLQHLECDRVRSAVASSANADAW